MTGRAWGLALGVGLDALVGDPRRLHPVAGFGALAAAAERRGWADTRAAGVRHTAVLVGATTLLGAGAGRVGRGRPALDTAVTALAAWAVLGGTSLAREGAGMARELRVAEHDPGGLDRARRRLPSLCGRDPASLDVGGLSRAALESVAENTADAVVGPLVWGAVAGVPGLLGYRAVNTLDAMVGHRSPRHERFGWASARLDDVANVVPARLAAGLTALLAPVVGGRPRDALRAWRRDAAAHPSPNAGPVEASFAGALGLRLGGRTVYPYGVQERPSLGDGRRPATADLPRAVRLSRAVSLATAVGAVGVAAVLGGTPRQRRP